jgi:hypothetical protein
LAVTKLRGDGLQVGYTHQYHANYNNKITEHEIIHARRSSAGSSAKRPARLNPYPFGTTARD